MKLFLKWTLVVAGLIGVSVINWVLLTNWHPVEYYWTLPGMLFSGLYSGIEGIILFPALWWIFSKKGLIKETEEYFFEKDES